MPGGRPAGDVYLIKNYNDSKLIKDMQLEDSLGAYWYKINDLKEDILSSFASNVIKSLYLKDLQKLFNNL